MKKLSSLLILSLIFLGLSLWAAVGWFLPGWLTGKADAAGQWGDRFGGVNALFSGFAMMGTVYALILQIREHSADAEHRRAAEEETKLTFAFNERKHQEDSASALKRHQEEIQAAEARHRESTALAIRKDVFYSLMQAAADAIFVVFSLVGKDAKLEDVGPPMARMAGEITKFQATAGKEAMEAAFILQEKLGEAVHELASLRGELDRAVAEIARIQAEADALPPVEGDDDLEGLWIAFGEEHRKAAAYAAEFMDELTKATTRHMERVQPANVDLILQARKELGLTLDEKWYRERTAEMLASAIKKMSWLTTSGMRASAS